MSAFASSLLVGLKGLSSYRFRICCLWGEHCIVRGCSGTQKAISWWESSVGCWVICPQGICWWQMTKKRSQGQTDIFLLFLPSAHPTSVSIPFLSENLTVRFIWLWGWLFWGILHINLATLYFEASLDDLLFLLGAHLSKIKIRPVSE